jgi:hypothetical protein
MTRKIPEAFNESRHIGLTMYTTCVIWLAFVPIYFSTRNNITIRMATLSFAVTLSATVCLVCLFAPKLYIIVRHPERNVRKSLMPQTKACNSPTAATTPGTFLQQKEEQLRDFDEQPSLTREDESEGEV